MGRILIVEDNPMNMELTRDILESSGYQMCSVNAAGCSGYIARPIDTRELCREVVRHLPPPEPRKDVLEG